MSQKPTAETKEGAEQSVPSLSQTGHTSLRLLHEVMEGIEPKMNICLKEAYKQTDTTTEQATAPCYQQAMNEWDKMLNVNYQYLMKHLAGSPDIKQTVVDAERHWINARDEQFKFLEQWELAYDKATGEEPEKPEMRGLDEKVKVVQNQAQLVFSALADLVEGGDPYNYDKPL